MTDVRAFQRVNSRGAYLVIGKGETHDDLQRTGRWLATDAPAEVRP